MKAKYFIGAAKVYATITGGGLLPLFNCNKATITQSEKETILSSSMDIEGGPLEIVNSLDKVGIELSCNSIHKENLAFFLKGDATAFAAGDIVDEVKTLVKKGTLVPLDHIGATDVVVKNSAGTTTYVLDDDYTVQGAGVFVTEDSTIALGDFKVSYSHPGESVVQALTQASKSVAVCIDGLNAANNGDPCVIYVHKVKFTVSDSMDFVGKDFVSITIKGTILKDSSKGSNESAYYWIKSTEEA